MTRLRKYLPGILTGLLVSLLSGALAFGSPPTVVVGNKVSRSGDTMTGGLTIHSASGLCVTDGLGSPFNCNGTAAAGVFQVSSGHGIDNVGGVRLFTFMSDFTLSTSSASVNVPISSSVASGSNGFACTTNGCRVDLGTGASDYLYSDGTNVTVASSIMTATNGTASAPAYSFAADPDTGFYRITSGIICFATNGSRSFCFDNAPGTMTGTSGNPQLKLNDSIGAALMWLSTSAVIADSVRVDAIGPSIRLRNSTPSNVAVTIQGAAAQTANLTEWNVNGGAPVASITANGAGRFSNNVFLDGQSKGITNLSGIGLVFGTSSLSITGDVNGRLVLLGNQSPLKMRDDTPGAAVTFDDVQGVDFENGSGARVAFVNSSGLGTFTGVSVTGTAVPSNGMYLIAPNAPALSSNGTGRVRWDDTGLYPVTDGALPLGKPGAAWSTVSIAGKANALSLPGSNATGRLDVDTETDELYFDTGARWRNVGSAAHYTIDKRFIADYALFESTASPANIGASTLTVTDAAAATTGATSNRDYRMSNTAASASSLSSLVSASRTTRQRGPRWSAWVKTGTNITSIRLWAGLTFASNSMTDDGTSSRDYVLFRYSTNASDGNWMACSGDATNAASCNDTGIRVSANTEYLLEIDCRNSAACVYWVNGSPVVRKTTNLPGLSSNLKTWFSVESLTAAARSFGFSNQTLETN